MSHTPENRTRQTLDLLVAGGRLNRLARLTTDDYQVLHRIFLRGVNGEDMHRMVQGALLLESVGASSQCELAPFTNEEEGTGVALDTLTLSSTTDTRSIGGEERHMSTTGTVPLSPHADVAGKGAGPFAPLSAISSPTPGAGSGGAGGDEVFPFPGTQSGTDLRNFIASAPERYTMPVSEVIDTGKAGSLRYRVLLGDNVYACFPKPRGAEQVAKIAKVHGIFHPMVKGRIYNIPAGESPALINSDTAVSPEMAQRYGMGSK